MIPIRRAPILRRDHSGGEQSGRRHTCAAWPRRRATPRPTRGYQLSGPWQDGSQLFGLACQLMPVAFSTVPFTCVPLTTVLEL
jgi:hypothetical protein